MKHSLVIMGVSGCGKSTLGAAVARAESALLVEGDAHHSAGNLEKMRNGVALTDADRAGWLDALALELRSPAEPVVLTCSALRAVYRQRLRQAAPGLRFVFLDITRDAALARVLARASTHFFSASLVDSQMATLESPVGEPHVLRVDASATFSQLLDQVTTWLHHQDLA